MNSVSFSRDHTFTLVESDQDLARFMDAWLPAIEGQTIAIDTEEDREFRYHPRIALLQVTRPGHDAILDPLRIDPAALTSAVEALCLYPRRVILHGGSNDIAGLKRDFNVGPARLGDTQLAARFLGARQFGLAALLRQHFHVELDKTVRRTDWGSRPLSDEQLCYARADTTHLLALWDDLVRDVEASGWSDALEEECAALADAPAESLPFDPAGWLRIRGANALQATQRNRATGLWAWRERVGAELNVNPSRVLAPWALLQLADRGTSALEAARRGGAIHRDAWADFGDDLCETLRNPPPAAERERRRAERSTGIERTVCMSRLDALLGWRNDTSDALGLEPGFLAPRQVLEAVARCPVCEPDHLLEASEVRHWRVERFTDDWNACFRKADS